MKSLFLAALVMASTVVANAAEITVLKTDVPATRGFTEVETSFYIDTEMKEAYVQFSIEERETYYVQNCSGYGRGYPGGYRGPGYPHPGGYPNPYPYCQTIPQTRYNTVLADKVKIEGTTMNGDEVIYQSAEGDIVCGTMGRSRVFRVPTFYLSGKCSLEGKMMMENGRKVLVVKFKTK